MQMTRGIIGGIIGGLIGTALWVGISYAVQFEIGWIAWLVGFLVGLGVRIGAPNWDGPIPGLLAVVLAIVSILAGKVIASEIVSPMEANLSPTAVQVKKTMAREIIRGYMERRERLTWPKGNTPADIQRQLSKEIYPESVLAEVEKRWSEMTEQQQQEAIRKEKERIEDLLKEFRASQKQRFMENNFRVVDYIFFALAAFTAYRIGSSEMPTRRY